MMIYDYRGNVVNTESERNGGFQRNITVDYGFYVGTNYSLVRVNRKRTDGSLQYPFVRHTQSRYTEIELANLEHWPIVLNSGCGVGGLEIENGILISDAVSTQTGCMALTIDQNGTLSYAEADTAGKGQQYIANGIVSATCGFFPIIDNYEDFDYPTDVPGTDTPSWQRAQRQIIGQYGNGDYAIITSDGRGFNNSPGFTMAEAQALCKELGLKFAYNLDGGGSTQTVIEHRNINLIYEGTTGRTRNSHIVFNGTTRFGIPD